MMSAELARTAFPVVSWWSLLLEYPLAMHFLKMSLDLQPAQQDDLLSNVQVYITAHTNTVQVKA